MIFAGARFHSSRERASILLISQGRGHRPPLPPYEPRSNYLRAGAFSEGPASLERQRHGKDGADAGPTTILLGPDEFEVKMVHLADATALVVG